MKKVVLCGALLFLALGGQSYGGFGGGDDCDFSDDGLSDNSIADHHDHHGSGGHQDGNFQNLTSDAGGSGDLAAQGSQGSNDGYDAAAEFGDWVGWIPLPYFDYTRRRAIIQLQNPEDRMYYSKKNQIFSGSPSNPHQVIDERTFVFGLSITNSNVAGAGGFGPGVAFYMKKDRIQSEKTSSYQKANQFVPRSIPKSFQEIAQWPDGATMLFKDHHYTSALFMAGGYFQGVDLRGQLQHGYTIKIAKESKKFTISFLSREALGGRAGLFSTPLARANAGGLIHSIHNYKFEFSLINPSVDAQRACDKILSEHDLSYAFSRARELNSGVNFIALYHDTGTEFYGKTSLGIPVLARYYKGAYLTHSITKKRLPNEAHDIYQVTRLKTTKYKLIRKPRSGSSEPLIIHNQNLKEKIITAKIDWQPGTDPKLGAKISYVREYDQVEPKEINERLNELGDKLLLDDLRVTFPSNVKKGAAIINLDLILEQGSFYGMANLARKDSKLFKEKTKKYLERFFKTSTSKFNPFFDQKKASFSKVSKRTLKNTMSDIKSIIAQLKDFRPSKHKDPTLEEDRIEDVDRLEAVTRIIAKNPFLPIALRGLGSDFVKYHFELKGEHFNPYVRNF